MTAFRFVKIKQEYSDSLNKILEITQVDECDSIVFDFFQCPKSTVSKVCRQLPELIGVRNAPSLIFINCKREWNKQLLQSGLLQEYLKQNSIIIPVFDQYYDLFRFLGIEDKHIDSLLRVLLYGRQMNSNNMQEMVDASQREYIFRILDVNKHLFRLKDREMGLWEGLLNPQELFDRGIKQNKTDSHTSERHIELPLENHISDGTENFGHRNNTRAADVNIVINTKTFENYIRYYDPCLSCPQKIRRPYIITGLDFEKFRSVPNIFNLNSRTESETFIYNTNGIETKYFEKIKFWKRLFQLDAFRLHVRMITRDDMGRHHLARVDAGKLLKDKTILSAIVNKVIQRYRNHGIFDADDIKKEWSFNYIICAPNDNAKLMAYEIQKEVNSHYDKKIEIIETEKVNNTFQLKERLVDKSGRLLILDDEANTGSTLLGILRYLETQGMDSENIEACVLIDRLADNVRNRVLEVLKHQFYALYRVDIPTYVENPSECPICKEIALLDTAIARPISKTVKEYCLERKKSIDLINMPGDKPIKNTGMLDFMVQLGNLMINIPYIYFVGFLMDLLGTHKDSDLLMKSIRNITDPEIALPIIDAAYLYGTPREVWLKYVDDLLDLGARINNYYLKKSIFEKLALIAGECLKERKILESIIEFFNEGIHKDKEIPFLAWLYHRINDPQLRDLLFTRIKSGSNVIKTRLHEITESGEITDGISDFNIISLSKKMREVHDVIKKFAPTDLAILITGETGTGKSRIAKLMHLMSDRKDKEFIPIHTSNVPKDLLDDLLFGHEEGAFSGAKNSKPGAFESADGGTVFIEEVGDIDFDSQLKFFRVLQEKEIQRIGKQSVRKVDVRIIAATSKNLDQEMEHGRFRKELYSRLKGIEIHIPPLSERLEDIRPLANDLISQYSSNHKKKVHGISDNVWRILESYHWPGNVRELRNAIESAIIMAREELITKADLPDYILKSIENNPMDIPRDTKYSTKSEERSSQVLDLLRNEKENITNKEYREIFKVSDETARRDLGTLVKNGDLEVIKKGPHTNYQIPKSHI